MRAADFPNSMLEQELVQAASGAAHSSGLAFKLHSMFATEARFEYTGPLGRRSAAQPRLPLRFYAVHLRRPAVERPLLHPFSDYIETSVRAVSLEEMAAEGIASLGARPRARAVYDLWFILTQSGGQLERTSTLALARQVAAEKGVNLRSELDPDYRPLLARAWDNALRKLPSRPPFAQAESEIHHQIETIL